MTQGSEADVIHVTQLQRHDQPRLEQTSQYRPMVNN